MLVDLEGCRIPKIGEDSYYDVNDLIPSVLDFLHQRNYYGHLHLTLVVGNRNNTRKIQRPVRLGLEKLQVELEASPRDDVSFEFRDVDSNALEAADNYIQGLMQIWRKETENGLLVLAANDDGFRDELLAVQTKNQNRDWEIELPPLETFLLYHPGCVKHQLRDYFANDRKSEWENMLWRRQVGGGAGPTVLPGGGGAGSPVLPGGGGGGLSKGPPGGGGAKERRLARKSRRGGATGPPGGVKLTQTQSFKDDTISWKSLLLAGVCLLSLSHILV